VVLTVLEEGGVGLILDICEVSTRNFNWLLFTPLWSHSPVLQPQPIHSGGGDNSGGGENTSHTTKALTRMKKKNKWTHDDKEELVILNFHISLSLF
jgi:hypothetical protein